MLHLPIYYAFQVEKIKSEKQVKEEIQELEDLLKDLLKP